MKKQSNDSLGDNRFNTAGSTSSETSTNDVHGKDTNHFKGKIFASGDELRSEMVITYDFDDDLGNDDNDTAGIPKPSGPFHH